jgi:hypothetical protein
LCAAIYKIESFVFFDRISVIDMLVEVP